MRIVPYDDMNDAAGFAQLSDSAFGYPHTPEQVARRRKLDPRYQDTFGFAMLDGRAVVGFVGVLDLKARTRTGKVIAAGGIHNVMTRPDYARKGISVRLFERAHDHFLGKGCDFSFLFTARSLVAWHLYRRLGYVEMPLSGRQAPAAYLVRPAKAKRARSTRRGKPDYGRVERLIAERWGKKRSTFINGKGWLRGRMKWWNAAASSIITDRDGFVYAETGKDTVSIYEFVARNRAARARLLKRVESLNRPATVHYLVRDRALLRLYKDRGYCFRPQSFFVCMARPLGGTSLPSAFGPDFVWSPLDQF
jgi:GNAT superfamily N-acetyltransferase